MKKSWNRRIIFSFVILAIVACATILFLLPYYNKYKVFSGIEAGQWNEVQESYEALDAQNQADVQAMLPDYAKHVCLEYEAGEKDYIYTIAAYDAINSIDETKSICEPYNIYVNRTEYKKAMDEIFKSNLNYDGKASSEAIETINSIHLRLDAGEREEITTEILNQKYQEYVQQKISKEEVDGYMTIIRNFSYSDAANYMDTITANIACIQTYRDLYEVAKQAYEEEDYFTALNICQAVHIAPTDTAYIDAYFSLYEVVYNTGLTYYRELLNGYVQLGDSVNTLALLDKMQKYYGEDIDVNRYKLSIATEWQKAYVSFAKNAVDTLKSDLAEREDGLSILDDTLKTLNLDSMVLYDIDENGVPELFLYDSKEENDTYTTCFVYTYAEGSCKFLGYAKHRSFCSDSSFVAFPWYSTRTSGDEYCLKRYEDGSLSDGVYVQNVDGAYYVNEETVEDAAYLSAQNEILANSISKGIKDMDGVMLTESERYILSYSR